MRHLTPMIVLIPILFGFSSIAQVQNSLHFDGSDNHIQTYYQGIIGSDPRTVEAWIKADHITSRTPRIISWGGHGGVLSQSFMLQVDPSGVLAVSQGVIANVVRGSTEVADSQWHHVAVTYDAGQNPTCYMYIDGQLDTSFSFAAIVNTDPRYNLKIGVGSRPVTATTKSFSGNIDEVRVWNYARTADQIDSFKNEEICPNDTGLVAYYRFNRGLADSTNLGDTVLADRSRNGHNGSVKKFSLSGSTSNWTSGASITSAPDNDTSFYITSCDSYTSPSGKNFYSSLLFMDTIANYLGCDSILTIRLNINSSSRVSYLVSNCDCTCESILNI